MGLQQPATIFLNDGSGLFNARKPIVLPQVTGWGQINDALFENGNIYLNRTIDDFSDYYGGALIQKINLQTLSSEILFSTKKPFPKHPAKQSWMDWIIPYQNNIVSFGSIYEVSVPQ